MPNTIEERMEDMSFAYLKALCAYNGYSLKKETEHDNDGVDATIKCKGYPCEYAVGMEYSPVIDVQLKSSYSRLHRNQDGTLRFTFEVKNYNELIRENRGTAIILVILHMYEDRQMWLNHSEDSLSITKCAYWVNLKGMPYSDNINNITIDVPEDNLLTQDSLKELMIRSCKGERL